MGRITSFSKQVIVFFLVTALIIRPTFAANVGGWTLVSGVAKGASTVYEGTKKVVIDGVDYIKKGTASITPNGTQVAKTLAKGAAGYALSFAVQELLGAVDWVLDPANNQIKYSDKPRKPYYLGDVGSDLFGEGKTREEACKMYAVSYNKKFGTNSTLYYYSTVGIQGDVTPTSTYWCYLSKMVYSTVSPNAVRVEGKINVKELGNTEGEVKTYPLPAIADYLIKKAGEGNTTAQGATTAAAADIVAEAEKDDVKARPIVQQLEASAQTKPADQSAAEKANEAQGQSKPNTQNPQAMDLSLKLPVFCGWAPLVCEAAQTVISFPTTLTDWWNTGKTKAEEWSTSISEAWSKVKEEYNEKPKEDTDTELDILDQSPPDINTDISFAGSCPASRSVPVSFAGISTEIEFSFQWFCEIASIAKPVIISISAFASALIVAGVRTEDD
ncbi:virulence factor TspB C-terminal domain-related protein [Acinetobacter junii]|uniref:virulence factor TspB C-terminal domain-related protein n=1 Tax=Acinetobacter junii TaxID=40215 RepID=UPI00124FCA6C|nr:virulence factor TspB C-terminal domain-related protein [Acinetobacter junii]